jgi:hypothetical protein
MKRMINVLILLLIIQLIWLPFNQHVKSENNYPTTLFISCENLDFNRWSKDSTPTMNFVIYNYYDGTLKGELVPSVNWIKVSETSFEGNLKEIIVKLDVSNIPPGLYKEKIEIKSNGGDYTLPIRLDLVEKKVIVFITYDNQIIVVDSKEILLNAAPFIMNGWSYIPLRIICESFGATVSFEYVGKERTKVITILYKDQQAKLYFNGNEMELNGIRQIIDGPIAIRKNTAFIPLNAIKEIFKPDIQYNSNFRTITLIY